MSDIIKILEHKKQIILQGPPGTGKTYMAHKMVAELLGDKKDTNFKLIQFHPSFTYEDFVRGITAKSKDGNITYNTENKILGEFAEKALKNLKESEKYVLIIDEINRANLSSVLGELIYALEYRGRKVESMYALNGENEIIIPENLYIIGTMNTADRSVGHIDYAIRRRFAFVDVLPNEAVIKNGKAKELFRQVAALFVEKKEGVKKNAKCLAPDFDWKDVQIGHSYFILDEKVSEEKQIEELKMKLAYEILPILNEYVKDGILLDTVKEEINKIRNFGL